MAKARLNGLDVNACLNQCRCVRVSQIMKAALDTDLATDALPGLGEIVRIKRTAVGRRERQALIPIRWSQFQPQLSLASEMGPEDSDGPVIQVDQPTGVT